MIELWSAQQHSWLAALGHEVLVLGAMPEAVETPASGPARRINPRPSPDPRPERPPVRSAPERAQAPPGRTTQPLAASRPATRMPDRLHFAVIRASGCNPNAPGAAELIAQWPAAAQLRGNPAGKRALWPQLRALRKQSLP